jgi:hypothetical protein
MGRLALTCATTVSPVVGPLRTPCEASSATVSWWGAICTVAGAAWAQAGTSIRQPNAAATSLIP